MLPCGSHLFPSRLGHPSPRLTPTSSHYLPFLPRVFEFPRSLYVTATSFQILPASPASSTLHIHPFSSTPPLNLPSLSLTPSTPFEISAPPISLVSFHSLSSQAAQIPKSLSIVFHPAPQSLPDPSRHSVFLHPRPPGPPTSAHFTQLLWDPHCALVPLY